MPAKDHVHMYQAVGNKRDQFMCVDPDCSHTQRKDLLIGKRAKCGAICGNEFILDSYALSRKTPRCYLCRKEKRTKGKMVKSSVMKDVLGL